MKHPITRLISFLLVLSLCFSMLPMEAFAWGKMAHTYTANLIEDEAFDGFVTLRYNVNSEDEVRNFQYSIPQEFLDAIQAYPNMFRAGALGPDMYPDILTGQMYIHPEAEVGRNGNKVDSGQWVTYLCNAVNRMGKDTEGRKMTLSFTLGCILHYCGDLFGHDFVNTFAGGAFPSLLSPDILDIKGERLNNILSHMSVEKYMDSLLYPTYDEEKYGGVDAPNEFITNVMVFNGSPSMGLAELYGDYPDVPFKLSDIESDLIKGILNDFFSDNQNNVPPHYTAFLALRNYIVSNAEEYRENMCPVSAIVTKYNDEWLKDVDAGIAAFTKACDNIAERMVTGKTNPKVEKQKRDGWKDDYNELLVLAFEACLDAAKENGVSQETIDAKREMQTLGVEGTSFFDEIIRELLREGIITQEMLDQCDGSITIIKEEFSYWWDEYVPYMIFPDIIVDGIEIPYIGALINLVLLGPLWTCIKEEIKSKIAEYVVEACTGSVVAYTGMSEEESAQYIASLVEQIDDRIEDPKLQLDHKDNPYKPSKNNFAELEAYMATLSDEKKYSILESDLAPLYNTLTMFQLMLMGPENYTEFVETNAGVTQTSYQTTTARPAVSTLKLRVKTSDLYLAGTNDNVYAVIYRINTDGSKDEVKKALMDISLADDFEADGVAIYTVELPKTIDLAQLEVALMKTPAFDFLPGITDDWRCENVRVTPLYAGYELTAPVDLGGVHMQGICDPMRMNFQTALQAKNPADPKSQIVTNLQVNIKVKDVQYAGSDSDIYLKVYNNGSLWQSVLLDKAMYNDLEQGDNDVYNIPVVRPGTVVQGIPLNRLTVKFDHTGSDESVWESVTITPCYGAIRETEAIPVGGKTFEESVWKPDFQKALKNATYRQTPNMSQTATSLKVQIDVADELFAGTDDDILLNIYSGDSTTPADNFLLDLDGVNDLEMGDTYIYNLPLRQAAKIPLNQLRLEFEHTGLDSDDELNKDGDEGDAALWDEVLVTAYNGDKALTDPISLGGTEFDEYLWDVDYQTSLQLHYTPVTLEYTTNLNGGLVSYMNSLDNGEEWVDEQNELWSNTTLREEIFFKIFKGFAPEIEYAGPQTFTTGNPIEITLDVTGQWNGVSYERRSQVKDFEHASPVEGDFDIEITDQYANVVSRVSGCKVSDGKVSITIPYNNSFLLGSYHVKVVYRENTANRVYADTEVTFYDAFRIMVADKYVIRGNVYPAGSGTTSGSGEVEKGKTCTMNAHPRAGYEFVEWKNEAGSVVSTNASYTFTVTENCTYTAVFKPITSSFKSVINDGNGTIELSRGEVYSLYVDIDGGTAPYTYEWQYLNPGQTTWTRDTTGSSASVIGSDLINGRRIRVQVTDVRGRKSISNEVKFVIIGNAASGEKLAVKINDGEKEFTFETNAVYEKKTLVANVTGGVGYCTYKWYMQLKGSSEWELVSEFSTYDLINSDKYQNAKIKVEVTDSAGEKVTSDEVTVKFKTIVVN